jgi:exo-1,4-beta-D-glucosaminidase
LLFAVTALAAAQRNASRIDLTGGWMIQSSDSLGQTGDQISSPFFDTTGWYPATVPTTVIRALVSDGVYADPYYGLNLRSIPGTTYAFGDNFAVEPMPADSPFRVSWWYRTQFRLPGGGKHPAPWPSNRRYWLNFASINYRANIWLNGRQVAGQGQVRGMFRTFEFDVTDAVGPGVNTLAVEVYPPTENDLSISFVDWNPLPADKDMGLVRDVYLLASGPVALRNVQVTSALSPALDQSQLTVAVDVNNPGAAPIEGTLAATIGDIALSAPVQVSAGQSVRISLSPRDYPQLVVNQPQLWWPNGVGPQNLYRLHLEFQSGGSVSDAQDVQFGIRSVTSELDSQQHRVFRINGQRILIRGAAWTPDMMLKIDPEREDNDLHYARDMNLNAIRFEGKLEMSDGFFDLADRYGILLLPGWCCCSFWEQWDQWQPNDYTVAAESLRSQVRRLRNHPSVLAFLYGSDNAPPPLAEQGYLAVLAQENWPNPYLAGAGDATTPGAGPTGVKMTGPYDYVPPEFWQADTQHGGAWGFNTETSPGPAIPPLQSLQSMMPAANLWPPDNQIWNFHAGSGSFADTRVFNAALDGRYGPAQNISDYVRKSQAMTYEAERAMFEAYGRNKYGPATGVIQWMMNNAWPGLIWHLYDWYLRPGGGYFGTKKACEPVHVQYSYDDVSVVVTNALYQALPGYTATAKVFNLDLTEMFSQTMAIDIAPDSVTRVFTLPAIAGLSRTYFVRLVLTDASGNEASRNFYWLSTQPDVMDWANLNYRYVPITTYMDLTGLDTLPPAQVSVAWQSEPAGPDQTAHVTVRNVSGNLAFLVHLTVLNGKGGTDVEPALWSDNYFELLPGEQREITATYASKLLNGAQPYIQVDGWNVVPAN